MVPMLKYPLKYKIGKTTLWHFPPKTRTVVSVGVFLICGLEVLVGNMKIYFNPLMLGLAFFTAINMIAAAFCLCFCYCLVTTIIIVCRNDLLLRWRYNSSCLVIRHLRPKKSRETVSNSLLHS